LCLNTSHHKNTSGVITIIRVSCVVLSQFNLFPKQDLLSAVCLHRRRRKKKMMDFIGDLNLSEKVLPHRNPSIAWFWLFLPVLIIYFSVLTTHINLKNVVGSIELKSNKNKVYSVIFPKNVIIEEIAVGHRNTDGPLVIQDDSSSLHYLSFSDTFENRIMRWEEGKGLFTVGESRFFEYSGCGRQSTTECEQGVNSADGIGSTDSVRVGSFDTTASVNLIVCQSGQRAITLLFENGTRVPLATHVEGRALNGPRGLVWSDLGHLYFTDAGCHPMQFTPSCKHDRIMCISQR
jgi:hypothetical protein